ncbi:DUF4190 domain-containing protein [Streptomyces sp. NPDC058373]|uniref:DUF4190 domain-containing protein n=1 Tax=Streptomyces sp. NPDC058373 TaxID=3346465 RepID=UPI0036529308
MSATPSVRGSDAARAPTARDNPAARVRVYAVVFAAFVGGGGYVPAALFLPLTVAWTAVILLSGLPAIVTGHVARRRAVRRGLGGRWLALAGIAGGWVCALVALLAAAALVGVVGGLAVLIGS